MLGSAATEMLIDLNVRGRRAIVVGGGEESEFKVLKLLDGEAKVTVLAGSFTAGLRRLASSKRLTLVRMQLAEDRIRETLRRLRPFVVIVSTGDMVLDEKASKIARSDDILVCVVDRPALNDFNMPAVGKVGDLRVAVSTQGMSPAMASILRKRVEGLITREDVLQVKLQNHLREASRRRLKDTASRKEFAYRIINDGRIKELLKRNRYREARSLAMKMLLAESRRGTIA